MSHLPNEKSEPLSRLTIFKDGSARKKQKTEAEALIPFLLKIDQLIEVQDVLFGNDPPDFILKLSGITIGMEHTTINPVVFGGGGNRRKKDFKDWQAKIKEKPEPVNTFEWGEFTLRQSLESLRNQFATKCQGTRNWTPDYEKKWLLLQLTEGSPFAELTGEIKAAVSYEKMTSDHQAKVLFEVSSVLAAPNPFDNVLIASGCNIIAFPANGKNPHRLPIPRWDVIARGAKVDDSHLNLNYRFSHVTRTGKTLFDADDSASKRI